MGMQTPVDQSTMSSQEEEYYSRQRNRLVGRRGKYSVAYRTSFPFTFIFRHVISVIYFDHNKYVEMSDAISK